MNTTHECPRKLRGAAAAGLLDIGATAVDLRDAIAFGERHLAGSVHIKVKSPDFAARVLRFTPEVAPLLLIADNKADANWAAGELAGKRSIAGYVDNVDMLGIRWPLSQLAALTPEDLHTRVKAGVETFILDVREHNEWEQGFIAGARHVPMNEVLDNLSELPLDTPIAITCAGGQRSSLIASRLMANGFTQLFNVTGGMKAWAAARLPVDKKLYERASD